MSKGPDFSFEIQLGGRVAGVDEVGRGPLAGPVMAAAVILDANNIPEGLNDSKKLSEKRRDALAEQLRECALVSIGEASVEEIEQINILQASLLAMRRAVEALPELPDHLLIDGKFAPKGINTPMTPLIKGDSRSLSIAAASIVAKVARDARMCALAQQYPGYGWDKNAGYPTKQHREALIALGPTPVHRRTFKTVHNILYQDKSATS